MCSDETSARVSGKTWWEWVFIGTLAVLHVIRPSRGKAVVQEMFGAIRPLVWVSDMLGSQRGHAVQWQVCLAHLLRDARYAIECGDTAFSAPFKWLLLRAIAIGRRRQTLKDTTLAQYHADLERRLDRIMAAVPIGEPGRKLRKRIAANRAHLFVFMTRRDVPYTNNVSERNLRPSVIFRKVTNGFRSEWGAETYAAFRSVVSTAKSYRASVLDALRFVCSPPRCHGISRPGVSNYRFRSPLKTDRYPHLRRNHAHALHTRSANVALATRPALGGDGRVKRAVVLFGAGASIEYGAPSTLGLTATIEREVRADPLMRQTGGDAAYQKILAGLTGYLQKPGIVQFEQVYHCIHELISMCPPTAGAFDEFRPLMLPFLNNLSTIPQDALQAVAHKIIEIIYSEASVCCETPAVGLTTLAEFIAWLRKDYITRIYTTNYDDFPLQAAPDLYTGFDPARTSPKPLELECFWQKENESSLFHLHGSVHMGFPHPLPAGAEIGELFWFDKKGRSPSARDVQRQQRTAYGRHQLSAHVRHHRS